MNTAGKPVKNSFKGYSLQELRYRKMVNSLKIRIVNDKLQGAFSNGAGNICTGLENAFPSFQTGVKWFDAGISLVRNFRRISAFFNIFA